jgi:hypothetical protein
MFWVGGSKTKKKKKKKKLNLNRLGGLDRLILFVLRLITVHVNNVHI